MSRRVFIFLIGIICALASCKKEIPAMTPTEVQHKIDSITAARIHESDVQAQRDLDDRIKIEVRAKVDSMVNARMNPKKDASNTGRPMLQPPVPKAPGAAPPHGSMTHPGRPVN